ncbi:MAG: tyrosine-type recombinase/integrase [Treponema sp.]|nr:tyrosine-type recombinase/integrase [Treponema sp.]
MRQEFSIVVRRGKKGFKYYVRYFVDNCMLPSQWSTRTDNYQEAVIFSKTNRENIIKKYLNRKEGKTLYAILQNYYEIESPFLLIDAARGRKLNESSRKILHGFVKNTFIPFLQMNKIKTLEEINAVLINRFQNYLLLEKKIQSQSINRQVGGIKAIFSHLYMTGVLPINTIKDVAPLKSINKKARSCYALDELKGIFKNKWQDEKSYLLCALIYTTGLRNSEITRLKVRDITNAVLTNQQASDFINIEKSKTASGIRKVPVHPKIKEALVCWVKSRCLAEDDFLFITNENQRFYRYAKKASDYLGSLLNKTPEELESENISFYSGRHFYKTMLNSFNLGDIEELFMGHKVNKNVSELYNHKNKRGEQELLNAARRAIEIIDICLF